MISSREGAWNELFVSRQSGIFSTYVPPNLVCMRVAFHENDGHHGNGENDEDNSNSDKQGVECWSGNHGHGNDENHGNPGCKPRVPQWV